MLKILQVLQTVYQIGRHRVCLIIYQRNFDIQKKQNKNKNFYLSVLLRVLPRPRNRDYWRNRARLRNGNNTRNRILRSYKLQCRKQGTISQQNQHNNASRGLPIHKIWQTTISGQDIELLTVNFII